MKTVDIRNDSISLSEQIENIRVTQMEQMEPTEGPYEEEKLLEVQTPPELIEIQASNTKDNISV